MDHGTEVAPHTAFAGGLHDDFRGLLRHVQTRVRGIANTHKVGREKTSDLQ